jgi:hypothetical protein
VNETKHNQCRNSKSGEENQLARLGRELLARSSSGIEKHAQIETAQPVTKSASSENRMAGAVSGARLSWETLPDPEGQ